MVERGLAAFLEIDDEHRKDALSLLLALASEAISSGSNFRFERLRLVVNNR